MWKVRSVLSALLLAGLALLIWWEVSPDSGPERASARSWSVTPESSPGGGPFKILHVMSGHQGDPWADQQWQGFQEALAGLAIETQVIPLNARRPVDPARLERVATQAANLIASWQPDLVYVSGAAAVRTVMVPYAERSVPLVFSGIPSPPANPSAWLARNVTGVLARPHAVETVALLRRLVPTVRRVALVGDGVGLPPESLAALRDRLIQDAGLEAVTVATIDRYDAFQDWVLAQQDQVDALGLVSLSGLNDGRGRPVPVDAVMRWTVQNSDLPDFAFGSELVSLGSLCAVPVSTQAQGLAAGRLARRVLTQAVAPDRLAIEPSTPGRAVVNLARARRLGLNPAADLFLVADVIDTLP